VNKPIPFGKYFLLERMNVGGMAEVFRAKAFGVEGFERLVAVKRILPNIAEDKEFIEMFVDEAKIAVQLNHANIAQIFDLGVVDGSYYIALEHIHGRDLRSIFDRCGSQGAPMPVAQACFVVMKVCEGLDYAHNKRDQAGNELNLVHRDVSPQNVLVSFEGEVKIIDFGIAKAAGKGSKTQAGILKGKFGYMSPEQVRGLPIDRRSDIFSCGIVLYELLTGERLFQGESDFSTLEKVRNVEILPPSTYNRNIPDELERIVLKALARDVEDRYQNAIDLHDELQAFVYTAGEFYSRKDLAGWMKSMFAREIEEETAKLESYRRLSTPDLKTPAPVLNKTGPRRSLKSTTVPPPVPQDAAARGKPAGAAAEARSGPLEWDDDELETSIYDNPPGEEDREPEEEETKAGIKRRGKPKRLSAAPPSSPAAAKAAALAPTAFPQSMGVANESLDSAGPMTTEPDGQPDLSALVRTARGWSQNGANVPAPQSGPAMPMSGIAPQSTQMGPPGAPPPGPFGPMSGERPRSSPATLPPPGPPSGAFPAAQPPSPANEDPSAVVAYANLGNQAPIFDSTPVPPLPERRGPRIAVIASIAAIVAVLTGGGVVLALNLAGGDDAKASQEPETATQVAGQTDESEGEEASVVAGGDADEETGFDLIVEPSDVPVKLDGQNIGRAPLKVRNLSPGTHKIELEAPPGFFNKTKRIEVQKGRAERVEIELAPMEIVGRFVSNPEGARVTLIAGGQERRVGDSPAQAELDPRERYEVRFEKEGYVAVTRPIEIASRPVLDVQVELEADPRVAAAQQEREQEAQRQRTTPRRTPPPPDRRTAQREPAPPRDTSPQPAGQGQLLINSMPPCRIFINGRDTGLTTPQRGIELDAGTHRITLVNDTFDIRETFAVRIEAGESTRVIKDWRDRLE
jgi:eukaryotic-like serine/threonine-protein kinase